MCNLYSYLFLTSCVWCLSPFSLHSLTLCKDVDKLCKVLLDSFLHKLSHDWKTSALQWPQIYTNEKSSLHMWHTAWYQTKMCLACLQLYRCREKLLLDAGYAASSKAIQVTAVGGRLVCWVMLSSKRLLSVREAPFPVTRSVYLLASSQTCCSLKD